ncbi:endonuclease/exonuclease/phosphatase family protein [Gossypium australe]|uniref:Endonuclease/exonuclease/phosphatase family protein n=1 Tax=Gossypium australe TaxID=47621 RepID=A0A5B6WHX4_9ROSI|nr:endonuclease/exonuclease/phosphatase family protein [Gossypium australe]
MVPKGACDEVEGLVRQFIWGSSGGSKKMALVSWDAICQPRSYGGFGFRHLSDKNSAFIMKLVGNRNNVHCWVDAWVPSMGPLSKLALGHVNINLDCKVSEMVMENSDWNLDLFRVWLIEDVIQHIVSIPPPLDSAGPNSISWSRSTTDNFFIKTTYWMMKEASWNPKNSTWNIV